jgi:mRNA interferase RelE/StbE
MDIHYRPNARKGLRKMPANEADKIMDGFERIARAEAQGLDIRPLTGRDGYRLRIGKWRAIYDFDGDTLSVFDVGPRGKIYK